jgi:hypothetical protein
MSVNYSQASTVPPTERGLLESEHLVRCREDKLLMGSRSQCTNLELRADRGGWHKGETVDGDQISDGHRHPLLGLSIPLKTVLIIL